MTEQHSSYSGQQSAIETNRCKLPHSTTQKVNDSQHHSLLQLLPISKRGPHSLQVPPKYRRSRRPPLCLSQSRCRNCCTPFRTTCRLHSASRTARVPEAPHSKHKGKMDTSNNHRSNTGTVTYPKNQFCQIPITLSIQKHVHIIQNMKISTHITHKTAIHVTYN